MNVRRPWRMVQLAGALILVTVLVWAVVTREPDWAEVPVASLKELERELEALRVRLGIPGMSAAVAEGDRISWSRGFGVTDIDRGIRAGPDTLYHLASVTKPYGSTILLQLAAENRLDLQSSVSDFGVVMDRRTPVRVWHLLTHTSSDPPGTRYRYDGNAFGKLTEIIEHVTGRPFARELTERIVRPLGLAHTAPNPGELGAVSSLFFSFGPSARDIETSRAIFDASGLDRAAIAAQLTNGYAPAWGRQIWPAGLFGPMRPMPHIITLSTTGGLVASAPDVARFSIAIDDGRLLSESWRERAWAATVTADGRRLPYGLGWFVQDYRELETVWHYGQMFESSSLLVKIPRKRLTFVILANSDGLSRRRGLGDSGNLLAAPAAQLFLNWVAARETLSSSR